MALSLSARSKVGHRNIHVPAQGKRKGRAAPGYLPLNWRWPRRCILHFHPHFTGLNSVKWLHLATSKLESAVSTKAATCPDKNPIEEEGRFAGQLSFLAMAFFRFTCLQTSKGLVLGLAVSLCQLLNWALVGGSLLNAIRPPDEIHLTTWDP